MRLRAARDPQPHTRERLLSPVDQQPLRCLTESHRRATELRQRDILDDLRQPLVHRVDVDAGEAVCAQADVGSRERPRLDVIELRYVLAPVVAVPKTAACT